MSVAEDSVNQLAGPLESGVLFAARRSGLSRSDDGGRTWTSAYAALALTAPLATSAVACSPGFAADGGVFAAVPSAILRSIDGGRQWEAAALPPPLLYVSALAVSPNFAADGQVFAGTVADGVWVSTDRGQSWAAWNFGLVDRRIMALTAAANEAGEPTLWAGTETGLFRSWNAGRAWREVALPAPRAALLSLAASAAGLFAGTEAGLLVSMDHGRAWRRLAARRLTGPINALWLSPHFAVDQTLAVIHADDLWLSADAGRSWTPRLLSEGAAPVAVAGSTPEALCVGLADGRLVPVPNL